MYIPVNILMQLSAVPITLLIYWGVFKLAKYDLFMIEARKRRLKKQEKKLEKERQKIKELEAEYNRRQEKNNAKIRGKRDQDDNKI
ncbi:hypothetical protein [Dolosigranulum pigrum]|nr:hypothetical protein [Dolosigranulum pigrum]QTJ43623.1 hypothetical protein FE327_06765 [Dolosigranulum pigrum]QTJ55105.1 hypothetical protein FE334_04820 [Dolosigranulum pigrum]QTJ58907.1 hypothetical protein FE336_06585 [Dolosigranulum pigrum]QTJ60560.1 hypothetical protein FE337_06955 [Dolosigranulum pigrum]RAN55117.1 hypothetical protein B8A33_08685 [Dolosigranulum pigrum]